VQWRVSSFLSFFAPAALDEHMHNFPSPFCLATNSAFSGLPRDLKSEFASR
jgi:hypothetical protein